MRARLFLSLAAVLVSLVAAGPAFGETTLQTGRTAGGSWEMTGERRTLMGEKGVCLDLTASFGDGSRPSTSTGCAFGSLRGDEIFPVSGSSTRGGETVSYLVGGLVVSQARTVRVRFADGTKLRLRARRPPKGFRRALRVKVRTFAGDALATTTSRATRVGAYDRRGRRIAGLRIG